MKLIFATNNQHKIEEVQAAISPAIHIVTLKDADIDIEIPEPHDTLEKNAAEKARTIFSLTRCSCFSEDSGLEVAALRGEPGVHSAHYAGERSPTKNIEKVLFNLKEHSDKSAQFRTVIFLILESKEYLFEGICRGVITDQPRGEAGFGYDPVFIPDGSHKTFAQMTLTEKNSFSHRKKALDKLVTFLNQYK